jgi:peptidoglycan/xylan/chitin deacetylase (PgdA/CDA1 family)
MGAMLLVLMVFLAIGASLLFYVRHWAARHSQDLLDGLQLTEGVYFKRYIPCTLRSDYDAHSATSNTLASRRVRWLNIFFSTGVMGLLVVVVAVALLSNRDRMLTPIDLSDAEVEQLDVRRHQWTRDVDDTLPILDDLIPAISARGVVLASGHDQGVWVHQGIRPGKLALEQWTHFLDTHAIPFRTCHWSRLLDCRGPFEDPIYVVTPGRWRLALLDDLLAQGASVLIYGAPAQVLKDREHVSWQGLRFEPYGERGHSALAVLGDQLLSLGLDAGLVVELAPQLNGYRVLSRRPQAVAIGEDGRVGGELETRLYARTAGRGRLVWLDFPPHRDHHYAGANIHHLDALVAAVFRYLLRAEYGAWASWPAGRRFAGLIEEDTEDEYHYAARVVQMVRKENFPITWFALSNLAQLNRDLTRDLSEVGEIACHGDNHADFNRDSLKIQVERLARCRKVLEVLTGQPVRGFRPPREEFNANTVDAVYDNQLDYFFAGGATDRAVPTQHHNESGNVISLPRVIADDYEIWHERQLDFEATMALVSHEMDWVEALGGLYAFSFHSQFMGGDERLEAVRQIGTQLRRRDAYFATARDIVDWWRFRRMLLLNEATEADDWERFRPAYLRVDGDGRLILQQPEHTTAGLLLTLDGAW